MIFRPGGGIVVRTTKDRVEFGHHLPAAEKEWIVDLLGAVMTS
jgi:hypothetical protein